MKETIRRVRKFSFSKCYSLLYLQKLLDHFPIFCIIFWQLLLIRLLECSGSNAWYIESFLQSLKYWSSLKVGLYGVMKRCFILLNYFVVVKLFELFWSTSHFLNVSLILEFLKIFFPIFFALNVQKKVVK